MLTHRDIASAVCGNEQEPLPGALSFADKWRAVINVLDPEKRNMTIWDDWDFERAYREEYLGNRIAAYVFLAELQIHCLNVARQNGIVSRPSLYQKRISETMFWFRKLTDKHTAVLNSTEVKHDWIN